jgi:hypothetical protein
LIFSLGCDEKLGVSEQSPHNWWFEDGHHRTDSEFGPCYTERGLREQFGVSINVWRLAGDTFNITCNFLYLIIRCTETFWSPCIIWHFYDVPNFTVWRVSKYFHSYIASLVNTDGGVMQMWVFLLTKFMFSRNMYYKS